MVGSASFLRHGYVHHNFPQTQKLISHNYTPIPKFRVIKCALTKQGDRFLTSISSSTLSYSIDPSPTHCLIHKFVSSSSKSVTLTTLNHLISPRSTHSRLFFIVLPVSHFYILCQFKIPLDDPYLLELRFCHYCCC